jgi:hypothetical protein
VVSIWLVLALLSVAGVLRLRIDASTESVLDRAAPEWQVYRESVRRFGNDEDLLVAFPAPAPFDHGVLRKIAGLSRDLAAVQGVERVDSVATLASVRQGEGGELRLEPLLEPGLLDDRSAFPDRLRQIAEDETAQGLLISRDGSTVALRLRLAESSASDYAQILADVSRHLEGESAWVSGVPVFREETGRRTRDEIAFFVPLTIVFIGFVVFVIFGSVTAVGIALGVSACGTLIVVGVMGAVGVPLTLSTAILPPVLLAIGCASTTHLLCETGSGDLRSGASEVGRPILLSGAITALAFLSGAVVPIDAIRFVGALGALGAVVLALCTMSLGTALVKLAPIPERNGLFRGLRSWGADHAVSLASGHSGPLLALWLGIFLVCGWGLSRTSLETDVTNWFPRNGGVREAYEQIRGRLSGISPMNIMIEAPPGRSVAEPLVIRAVHELAGFLESRPSVDKATSIAVPLARLHAILGDPPGSSDLPESEATVQQYLLLLDATEEVGELITTDRSVANIPLRVGNNGSEHLLAVSREAKQWWSEHGIPGYAAVPTGIMFEFARAEHAIAVGQLGGLALDVATLACLYLLVFRSGRLTVIALVPSVVTVIITFGLVGFLGSSLDAGTVFVGMLAVGVTVDETIHVVSAFGERLAAGGSAVEALEGALRRVFPALIVTTIALAGGFALLGMSSFALTKQLGLLTSVAMLVSAAASSTLLPALLRFYRGSEEGSER